MTNCKNKICFRVGGLDARQLAEEFSPLMPNDLMNLPDYHFYGKILLDGGVVSDPFFAKATMPAKVLRNYETYVQGHRAGRLTIDEIEEDTRTRHRLHDRATMFSGSMALEIAGKPEPRQQSPRQRGARGAILEMND